MDDGTALLAAIRKHRAEDVPRLAYADWCDENGQPERAKFIRAQCKIESIVGRRAYNTHLPSPPDGRLTWCDTAGCFYPTKHLHETWCEFHVAIHDEQDLFKDAGLPGWFNDLPGSCRNADPGDCSVTAADGMVYLIRRGFPAEFHGYASLWLKHCDVLTALYPIERVHCTTPFRLTSQPDGTTKHGLISDYLEARWPGIEFSFTANMATVDIRISNVQTIDRSLLAGDLDRAGAPVYLRRNQ